MRPLARWGFALLTAGVLLTTSPGGSHAAFPGENGLIAFAGAREGNSEIYSMNPDSTAQRRLTTDPAVDIDPAWSADGSRIAFTSNRSGNDDIYVMDAQGRGVTQLTTSPGNDENPAWSPGNDLVFTSTRDGNSEIYVMNADGSGQARLTTNAAPDANPAWSPDGTKIAFASNRDGNYEIYVMNVDGTNQTRLTTAGGDDKGPSWSPDGSRIAFASDRDGLNHEIYVMDANGGNQTRLTRNTVTDLDPAWSPDGNQITFTSRRDGDAEIYTMFANGTAQTRLTTSPAEDTTPDWQPKPLTSPPPPPLTETYFAGRWRVSLFRGALVVKGSVPGPAKLQLALRRGARTYMATALDLPAGSFQRRFSLRRNLLPTNYVLDVGTTGSPTELSPQHMPVSLKAPPEGVVTQAWASTAVLGPPLTRLPPGTSIAWAHFRFADGALPAPGRMIVVSWQGPAKTKRPPVKPRRTLVVAWLGQPSGPPLPRGRWVATLTAGGTVVKQIAFRIA